MHHSVLLHRCTLPGIGVMNADDAKEEWKLLETCVADYQMYSQPQVEFDTWGANQKLLSVKKSWIRVKFYVTALSLYDAFL